MLLWGEREFMLWVKIFSSREEARKRVFPGTTQLLIVHGKRICLALLDQQFYAVEDRCSHQGESLSKGKINYLGEVICPWHGYRFNLKTGRESDERSKDIGCYPIREDGQGIFIGL